VAEPRPTAIFPVIFDEPTLAIDSERLPPTAAAALQGLRTRAERSGGISQQRLKRCLGEARDGTDLTGCVKTYVPWPDGPWGIVFRVGEDSKRPFALYPIAYGRRHPHVDRVSVYQLAHKRLHS
jgi:hypothetical protein